MDFSLALCRRAATLAKQTAEQLLGVNCLFKGTQREAGYRSTPWTSNPFKWLLYSAMQASPRAGTTLPYKFTSRLRKGSPQPLLFTIPRPLNSSGSPICR